MNDHDGIISRLGASLGFMGLMEGSWVRHGGLHRKIGASESEQFEKWGVPEKVGRGKPVLCLDRVPLFPCYMHAVYFLTWLI